MFIQPVSMECTQEQYERDLKEPLLEMGYTEIGLTRWNKHPYLVTNFLDFKNVLSKVHNAFWESNGLYFIDHYNPELFLALAAMTEKRVVEEGELGGLGEWITVKDPSRNRYVKLLKNNQFFNDAWRKATKEELINKFTKKEEMEEDLRELLHSGDIVELRNGKMGIVIDTHLGKMIQLDGAYAETNCFNNELKGKIDEWDIQRIMRINYGAQILPKWFHEAPIIWERKEPKEITLQELIEKAGYKAGEIKVKFE